MGKLIQLTDVNIDNFVDMLTDSEIVVYENVHGSKVYFNYDGKQFSLKTRTLQSEPVNKIDMVMQKFYEPAINYLNSIDDRAKKLLPRDWWFCCEYFYNTQPSTVAYDKMPKHHLMITSIVKGKQFTYRTEEIIEYATLMDIDYQSFIFQGKLSEKQVSAIAFFLQTNEDDLEFLFGQKNFAEYFYSLLSPDATHSTFMENGTFQDAIDKIIIRFANDDEMALALLNPLYKKEENPNSEFIDSYSILLADFMEYLQMQDIEKMKPQATEGDAIYLEVMSALFNGYCAKRSTRIVNFDFSVPPFLHDSKFQVNMDIIDNARTRYFVEKDKKLEYMFRIVISSFRSPKRKAVGVLTDRTVEILNDYIYQIRSVIDRKVKLEAEMSLQQDGLLNFSHFFNMKYPMDAAEEVYPDLYNALDTQPTIDKKKKTPTSAKK